VNKKTLELPNSHFYGFIGVLSAVTNNPDIIFGLLKKEIEFSDIDGIFTEEMIAEAANSHVEKTIDIFNRLTEQLTFEEIEEGGVTIKFGQGGEENPFKDIDFGDFRIGLN